MLKERMKILALDSHQPLAKQKDSPLNTVRWWDEN
jgi:hypothetical protein